MFESQRRPNLVGRRGRDHNSQKTVKELKNEHEIQNLTDDFTIRFIYYHSIFWATENNAIIFKKHTLPNK